VTLDRLIGDQDEYLFSEGTHHRLWEVLGAHPEKRGGKPGVRFAVWAPGASKVSVLGDFNGWDGNAHPLEPSGSTGIWAAFVPGAEAGQRYKYKIISRDGTEQPLKADPVAFGAEHPPENASVVRDLTGYTWRDGGWIEKRGSMQRIDQPMSIYEVHLGSWRRRPQEGNRALSYYELSQELVPYVKDLGFTHIELMPVSEYPFDGSWGYQPTGLFAPTIRHGTPDEFREFITACHDAEIGVILDWVPGHFPTDPHGLGRFTGEAVYEHGDPCEGFHQDWNTFIYNYGRTEVANFLVANAIYWLEEFHIDGLRVDAVASMLYRDYSRKEGEWVPNVHGGRENLEAIAFLKRMNEVAYAAEPGIMTIAEESTAFPGVSRPTSDGGLGFGFKWNMGWMHDTLEYMKQDPVHRRHHHNQMTFGLHYAFSENFILPLSHDEVVHGKGSLLGKMPGNDWERFANLRAYFAFMWAHPGKKLIFMGCELAQAQEWNHDGELAWGSLLDGRHAGMQSLIRDLNNVYRDQPALHRRDTREDGFQWIDGGNTAESVMSWIRWGEEGDAPVLCLFNFTPVERTGARFGVPRAGYWREVLNSDADVYAGGGRGNLGGVSSEPEPWHGQDQSVAVTLPPLSGVYFVLDK
jgi:1,4-alpha-glucan branching enzyme